MSGQSGQPNDPFAYLAPHQFVVLTTYRKSGQAAPTTVWQAYADGKVYMTTNRDAGKIKRIRADGRVQLAPSDRVGNLLGEPLVEGHAHEAVGDERTRARDLLAAKYGAMWTQIAGEEGPERTYIVVEPAQIG